MKGVIITFLFALTAGLAYLQLAQGEKTARLPIKNALISGSHTVYSAEFHEAKGLIKITGDYKPCPNCHSYDYRASLTAKAFQSLYQSRAKSEDERLRLYAEDIVSDLAHDKELGI